MAKKTYAQKKAEAKAKKARLATLTDEQLVAEMKYETLAIEHIIAWCKLNNQVDWLKTTVAAGVPILDTDGSDTGETREYDFMSLKRDFNKMFGADGLKMLPEDFKKEAAPRNLNMFELIASL